MKNLNSENDSEAVKETWEAFVRSRFDAAMSRRTARADVVERELAALNASLVSARRFRNAGVSASCGLPAELLTSIFLHLQANWQPERHKISEGAWKLTLGWMTVLQVCNLWRETAINTPSLWTDIPCSELSPHYIPIFLTRSRNLPLTIRFTTYATSLSEMCAWGWLTAAILRRAETLCYREEISPDGSSDWRLLFQHRMPLLKSLELATDMIITPDMFMPPTNRPHALTRLRLSDCSVPANSPLLSSSLTHLFLESSGSSQPEFPDLTSLPNLRELELVDVFPIAQERTSTIQLPSCLKLLRLEARTPAETTSCFHLIARLKLPLGSTARLEALYTAEVSESESEMMKGVLEGFFTDSSRPVIELRVSNDVIDTLYGPRTPVEWTHYPHGFGETLAVDRIHGARHTFCQQPPGATTILSCISLAHLRSVHLSDWSIDGARLGTVTRALQHATQLNRLSLQSPWQCERLLRRLGEVAEDHAAGMVHPSFELFPQLEVVVLHNQSTWKIGNERNWPVVISCTVALFLDFLEMRSRHGAPVRELFVEESLKDWDAWALVGRPTAITFFKHTPEPLWDIST